MPAGTQYSSVCRFLLTTAQPWPWPARPGFCDGTQDAPPALPAIRGPRSTISPRSMYSHSRPSSSGRAVNGGHRVSSLPTIASTRTCGPLTSDLAFP